MNKDSIDKFISLRDQVGRRRMTELEEREWAEDFFRSHRLEASGSRLPADKMFHLVPQIFLYAIRNDINGPVSMEDVADAIGKPIISLDEYLEYVQRLGVDIEEVKRMESEAERRFLEEKAESQIKAQSLLYLLATDRHITDEQIHKHLDRSSIFYFVDLVLSNSRSVRARMNARRSHLEHEAMKNEAFDWLDSPDASLFRTMDDKATQITRLVPIKFRAARRWVGEWKKLRSASSG